MAAADEHAVGALGEGVQDELRVDAAGAHQADDADVGAYFMRETPARSAAV
jgi:hypothetical protein